MAGATWFEPSNAEQVLAWDGDEGAFWAEHADQFDLAMHGYQHALLDAAKIGQGDRILDIGCGTGQTTRDAARIAVQGSVLGLDLSERMLAVARERAADEDVDNVVFEQADVQVHALPAATFDVAVSRTGTMFFADPVAAFVNVASALRTGGLFVQLVWQPPSDNPWFLAFTTAMAAGRALPTPPVDAPGSFSLSDPQWMDRLLTSAGFSTPRFAGLSAPMQFGANVDQAFAFVAEMLGWMLDGLDVTSRARALDDLRSVIRSHATEHGVLYPSATWLVTARLR